MLDSITVDIPDSNTVEIPDSNTVEIPVEIPVAAMQSAIILSGLIC